MSWEQYQVYKDSGIDWLGEIPAHWEIKRAKTLLREINKPSLLGDEILLSVSEYTGVRPRSEILDEGDYLTRADSLQGYKRCEPGDLIMNIMLAWKRGQGIAPCAGIVSPAYAVYRPIARRIDSRYTHYLVRSDEYVGLFGTWSYGVIPSRWRLYPEVFLRLPLLLPPFSEQRAIAAFLDRETKRIDTLIVKKERQIELLQEKEAALISRAVTKGLDRTAKMRDSGVEWIGEMPSHWEVKPLKRVLKVVRGKFSHRPRNDPRFYDGQYPFIQTADIVAARKYIRNYQQTLNEDGMSVSKMFPRGTLVMSIAANIGDMGILDFDACFPDSIVGFIPSKLVDLNYCYYSLLSLKSELLSTATLNTQLNINVDRIGTIRMIVPPKQEQSYIADFLDMQEQETVNMISRIRQSVQLLEEYRTALISAAVTGKIDVSEEVA